MRLGVPPPPQYNNMHTRSLKVDQVVIWYFIAELKLIGLRCPYLKGTEWGTVKVTDASV
jgi:hypothetical protein